MYIFAQKPRAATFLSAQQTPQAPQAPPDKSSEASQAVPKAPKAKAGGRFSGGGSVSYGWSLRVWFWLDQMVLVLVWFKGLRVCLFDFAGPDVVGRWMFDVVGFTCFLVQ